MLRKRLLAAVAAAILPLASACFAATWTGASNGFPFAGNDNWSNAGNWAGFAIPVSFPGTDVIFGGSPRLTPIQDLGNDFAIHNLVFNAPNYHLVGFSIAPAFIFNDTPSLLISNNISMPGTMSYGGEGSATLGGILSGGGGLIMNGNGQLTLGSNNTFTGTTQINSGQIVLGVPNALANSTVIINSNNGLNTNNHQFPVIGGLSGSGNLILGDAFFDTAYLSVGGNNSSTTFSGSITAPGGFRWVEKLGTGTLTLSGSNSNFYLLRLEAGAVVLSGGSINTTLALGAFGNSTPLTIQNGAVVDGRPFGDISYVGGNSLLRITGAGTIWRPGDARIAFFQNTTGNIIVENGAAITDTSKFIVGQGGNATLLLQSGATINNTQGVIGQNSVGVNNPAVGTATVTGAGSTWTNGTLNLGGLQAGVTGGVGNLNINSGGAVISTGATSFWTTPSTIKVNGGTFVTGSLVSGGAGFGSIELTDPAGGTALTINGASGTATYSGPITGTGGILKTGSSTQILSGNLTYLGGTTVNGGTLQIPQSDLGSRSLRANPGGTILYNTPLISGGFLRGSGNHDLSAVSRLSGTTIASDAVINQNTPLTMLNVTAAGTINNNAAMTLDGFTLTSAGKLNLTQPVTSQAFESAGVINIIEKGVINNTGDLVLGAGSRTFLGTPQVNGGKLDVSGGTLELNGALLVNNGEIYGTTNVNFGSLAKGVGKYGPVNVTDGGRFSPGNSPGVVSTGSTSWASGGSYLVEIGNEAHDQWLIDGLLSLNASPQHPFAIALAPLDDLIFDNTRDQGWTILHASDGLNLEPSALALDTTGFKNLVGAGHFTLQNSSTDLIVNFSAVPEPTALGLLAAGALMVGRRRRIA